MKKLSERRYMQFLAAIAAALGGPAVSTHATWASPALPILQSSDSPLGRPATSEEASWIVSIKYLALLPGAFLGGYIAQKYGRKISMMLGAVISLVAWIIIVFARDIVTIYVARCIAGISVGVIGAVIFIYVGEIADNDIRGMLGMVASILAPISSMIILSAGPYMSYKALALLCCVPPVLFIALFFWMPETPHFFVNNGDIDAAKRSLKRLSANNTKEESIDQKITKLQELSSNNISKNKITLLEFLTSWKYLYPFLLVAGLSIIYLLSGSVAIEAYMQTIISASQSSLSPELSSIIFGIVKIPPVLVAIFLCDKLGRRPLFALSGLGCAIALIGEGIYFYTQEFHEDYVDHFLWLPTTALSAFLILAPLGFTTVPHVILSEILPSESKEISSSVLQLFTGLIAFGVSKSFVPLSSALGVYTMFWFFSGMCLLGCAYMYIFIPETKGKSFAEIQEKLYKRNNSPIENTKITV